MKQLDNKMKEFLKKKLLKKKLGIKELGVKEKYTDEDYQVIENKIEELDLCKQYLESIRCDIVDFRNDLRRTFKRKLYERLGKEEWICMHDAFLEQAIIDNSPNFGFKWNKGPFLNVASSNDNLYLHIEIQDWERFLCGIFSPSSVSDELKNDFKKLFEDRDIKLDVEHNWMFLPLNEYGEYSEVAHCVYGDKHNTLFGEKVDDIVQIFYDRIEKMCMVWREICEELDSKIDV